MTLNIAASQKEEVTALEEALDALTDAMHYHQRRCVKDQPHDHALLRKLQHAIARLEALSVGRTA